MTKETKPALATADVTLIKKTIKYYLINAFPVEKKEHDELTKLHHRLGRLEKSS